MGPATRLALSVSHHPFGAIDILVLIYISVLLTLCFSVLPIAIEPKEAKTKENITKKCLFITANKSANEFSRRRNRQQTFDMIWIVTLVTFDP